MLYGLVRWQVLLPRLAALVVVVLAVQLCLARFVRWQTARTAQRSVGAKVDVAHAQVALIGSRVTLCGIAVANPHSPLRNLIEADRCDFQFEPTALLHKRTVVRHGRISGVRFGTPRETSGALAGHSPDDAAPPAGWIDEQAAAQARAWLDRLHAHFQRDLLDELESIRLTEELLDRWPDQYAALDDRVKQLRRRIDEYQAQVRQAQANPLRHVEFLEQMPDEIARIRSELALVGSEIQHLPGIADDDRRAIALARQQDEQYLRDQLQFEPIDTNLLTAYLLQEQLAGPMADLVGWLRWMRQLAPADASPVTASGRRGRNVVFRGCTPTPDFLIRSLDVGGTVRLGGQTIELVGTLSDFSDQPALHNQPMRLRLAARGSRPMALQATIDRTGPVARDQLLVDCGGIVLPKLKLGGSDKLRLSLEPTTATLNVSITLEGNRLSGDIQLVQKQVQITPSVVPELEHLPLPAALDQSLRDIRSLATRVSLGGTLDEPKWKIWSNVGPAVAEAMDRALDRTAELHARRLLADSQQQVNERLAQLDREIAEQQTALMPHVSGSTRELEDCARGHSSTGRVSLEHLGRRLPADSLFR